MKESEARISIVKALSSKSFISGEAISSNLGCSRAGVWKHIKKLREEGYDIEAVSNKGYRIRKAPDKLFSHTVKEELNTELLGQKGFHYFESIPSTNDKAYELAEKGCCEGVIVAAESQTGGKGRLGRKWSSPEGGVYLSIVLRPEINVDRISSFALIAGCAVARAVSDICSLEARVKWPNDILIGGKKVCGILMEMKAQPDMVDFLILGIGINVNTGKTKLPEGATSLCLETGDRVSRVLLVKVLLEKLEKYYYRFRKDGFSALRDECKDLSFLIGEKVIVKENGVDLKGEAVDIDEYGALILEMPDKSTKRVFSGDVVRCRKQ